MAAAESCDLGGEANISLRNFASYFANFADLLIVSAQRNRKGIAKNRKAGLGLATFE